MNKIFESKNIVVIHNHYAGIMMAFGFYVLLPILLKGRVFFIETFIPLITKDVLMIIIFITPPLLWHLFIMIVTSKFIKELEIGDNMVTIKLFGFIRKKIIKWNYSDISSLEYHSDQFRDFVFTLKNKKQKRIRAEIKYRDEAFKLIQQKISNKK